MRGIRSVRRFLLAVGTAVALVLPLALVAPAAAAPAPVTYTEPYRPQYHFTPARNWMNDPNGLLYYRGEYHLFFQHNPSGNTWGNISWGHAVSRDLVHWRELPVAIPATAREMAWSGSAVIDRANTSGLGRTGQPAMVAVYTAYDPVTGDQTQNLAYSLDRGRTFTKYAGNPVLDDPDPAFRDPKVFWHAPTKRWVMVIVLAAQRKVAIYSSPDLKAWTKQSTFGPANAIGGVWEVPDLFPVRVPATRGQRSTTKWVLKLGINPGAIAGGSGDQYLVGDFDGSRFTADRVVDPSPPRDAVPAVAGADFEGAGWAGWTTTGTAFGPAPARGPVGTQTAVVGFQGSGFANSFASENPAMGGDAATGTLTSPAFTISQPHLALLVGGARLIPGTDPSTAPAGVELVVDGVVVRRAFGLGADGLDWISWDVRDLVGRTAQVRAVDRGTASGQHVVLDQVMASPTPVPSVRERADWIDHGKDFYASVTWTDAPSRQPLAIGWMSNWQYATRVPTSPWRSAQSLVKQWDLERWGGRVRLVQQPVPTVSRLRRGTLVRVQNATVPAGIRRLTSPGAGGQTLEIEATFSTQGRRAADAYGLHVLAGNGRHTEIGYDARRQEVYVDRRLSGDTSFSTDFVAEVQRAPLRVRGGTVRLHIFVDTSSVEVFAEDGRRVLTDLVFPPPDADGVALFARGGQARVDDLVVRRLAPAVPRSR